MTDAELLRDYTRVSVLADALVIDVCRFELRPKHCMPVAEWFEAVRLPLGANVAEEQQRLLADSAWFAQCARCGSRRPIGYSDACSCGA